MDSAAQRKYTTGEELLRLSDAGNDGRYLLTTESPRRDGDECSLAQLLDHGEYFLFSEDAFAFQQLHQRRGLPHAGVALMAGPLWRSRRRDRGRLHIAGLLPRPPHDHTDLRRARIGRTQGKCSVVWS